MVVLSKLALGFLLVSAACGGGDDDDGGGGGDGGPSVDADLFPERSQVFPRVIYAGYDGSREFLVPVSTDLPNRTDGEVTWSSGDESIVEIEPVATPDDAPLARGTWALITTTGSGDTTISGTIGEYTVTAETHVTGYTVEQVNTGEARYHLEDGTGDRVACASCHLAPGGADHTPTEMAFHDDDALLLVATEGHYPDICSTDDGDPCTCGSDGCDTEPGYVLGIDHTWNFTEVEADGIVPYLRSLPPRGF